MLPQTKNLYSKSYFEAARSMEKRSILSVCEDFEIKADAKRALLPKTKNLYSKSYFEAARRARNRSILSVCEDFEIKADAERALLDRFFTSL